MGKLLQELSRKMQVVECTKGTQFFTESTVLSPALSPEGNAKSFIYVRNMIILGGIEEEIAIH